MPFYEYQCQNGHVTEQLRKYEEITVVCPECNAPANRLFPGKFNAIGLPNGFIGNNRRTNIHDKRIDPKKFISKNAETL